MIKKLSSSIIISIIFIGCSSTPEPMKISNNVATSQLFLIGEMSSTGHKFLGTRNNMMVFQNRRTRKTVSFSVEGDNSSSTIKFLGEKSDSGINNTLTRVKSYSEQWKDKNDKQVSFSAADADFNKKYKNSSKSYSPKNNSKFSQSENTDLLPTMNTNINDPMPFDESRRYKGSNDPALRNRL